MKLSKLSNTTLWSIFIVFLVSYAVLMDIFVMPVALSYGMPLSMYGILEVGLFGSLWFSLFLNEITLSILEQYLPMQGDVREMKEKLDNSGDKCSGNCGSKGGCKNKKNDCKCDGNCGDACSCKQ